MGGEGGKAVAGFFFGAFVEAACKNHASFAGGERVNGPASWHQVACLESQVDRRAKSETRLR